MIAIIANTESLQSIRLRILAGVNFLGSQFSLPMSISGFYSINQLVGWVQKGVDFVGNRLVARGDNPTVRIEA